VNRRGAEPSRPRTRNGRVRLAGSRLEALLPRRVGQRTTRRSCRTVRGEHCRSEDHRHVVDPGKRGAASRALQTRVGTASNSVSQNRSRNLSTLWPACRSCAARLSEWRVLSMHRVVPDGLPKMCLSCIGSASGRGPAHERRRAVRDVGVTTVHSSRLSFSTSRLSLTQRRDTRSQVRTIEHQSTHARR
jgi:hypothetical protein